MIFRTTEWHWTVNVDDCVEDVTICGSEAVCNNKIGAHFCTCNHGYRVDLSDMIENEASQEEDPGLGTSAHGAAVGAARPTQPTESRRRGSSASSMRPQDHPFLQLQQTGFNMLERELAGMRRATNTRLDRVAMLLRPLGRIASSLDRIATAMERAWPPNDPPPPPVVPLPPPVVALPPPVVALPPPVVPLSPPVVPLSPPVVPLPPPVVPLPPPIPSPSTRSTRSTSSIATPGPSYIESRLGRRKRPYRGGRK
ncbi:unnamed protein product [Boreogadus saida]